MNDAPSIDDVTTSKRSLQDHTGATRADGRSRTMGALDLIDTAHSLVGAGKGLLAIDESNGTCNKRFAALGIAQTEEQRRAWRELMVTTPDLGDSISGVIIYDETIRQRTTNAHTQERDREVTEQTLHSVFSHLHTQNVKLEGMILKPNMVLPGLNCPTQASVIEVATATVNCFLRVVPAAVPGIAFLSGGQSAELASTRLNAINVLARSRASPLPWPLVFSFARAALQGEYDAAMEQT